MSWWACAATPLELVFEVVGEEALALPDQVLASALQPHRAALGTHDGAIDVWLDPLRGHMPGKLAVGQPDEHGWELEVIDDKAAPRR